MNNYLVCRNYLLGNINFTLNDDSEIFFFFFEYSYFHFHIQESVHFMHYLEKYIGVLNFLKCSKKMLFEERCVSFICQFHRRLYKMNQKIADISKKWILHSQNMFSVYVGKYFISNNDSQKHL